MSMSSVRRDAGADPRWQRRRPAAQAGHDPAGAVATPGRTSGRSSASCMLAVDRLRADRRHAADAEVHRGQRRHAAPAARRRHRWLWSWRRSPWSTPAVSLVQRWFSARVGEGLIYDLRTEVFVHVQRQPIAFFTRTQTGSLVSRINSDVMGAQQAFTSTLSGVVSNLVSLVLVAGAMFFLSWQITLAALVLVPVFLLPGALHGPPAGRADPAADAAQRRARRAHDRAVQRGRCACWSSCSAARPRRSASTANAPPGSATPASRSR